MVISSMRTVWFVMPQTFHLQAKAGNSKMFSSFKPVFYLGIKSFRKVSADSLFLSPLTSRYWFTGEPGKRRRVGLVLGMALPPLMIIIRIFFFREEESGG